MFCMFYIQLQSVYLVNSCYEVARARTHTHTHAHTHVHIRTPLNGWENVSRNLLRQQVLRISSQIVHLLTLHIVHMRVCLRPCMRAQTVMHSSTSMHCAHSRPSFPICVARPCCNISSAALHRWFTHFYVWAVTWDLLVFTHLVLVLLLRKPSGLPFVGHILHVLTSLHVTPPQSGIALQCTQTEWEVLTGTFLLLVQASRRLYECLFVLELSKQARMHLTHYLVGLLFYTLGAPTMVLHWKQGGKQYRLALEYAICYRHV